MLFVTKQKDLWGTGRLHALVHVFVALFDAQAELENIHFEVWEAVYAD